MKSSTTVAGARPAFTISRMSPSSRISGAGVIVTGGLPAALKRAFSFFRCSA